MKRIKLRRYDDGYQYQIYNETTQEPETDWLTFKEMVAYIQIRSILNGLCKGHKI